MTTEPRIVSPLLIEYRARRVTLAAIAERLTDPTEREAFAIATVAFDQVYLRHAEQDEKRLHIQYWCGICYNPIPIGEDVRLRGDNQLRRAHKACEHIYYGNMAELRKQIAAGKPRHEPGKCYAGDKCPLLAETPQMGKHPPVAWSEQIEIA